MLYEITENRIYVGRWTVDLVVDPDREGITKDRIGKVFVVGSGSHYSIYINSANPISAYKNGVNRISKFKSLEFCKKRDGETEKAEEISWMDRDWECPYCGSRGISDYNKVKIYGQCYETLDVMCGGCDNHYHIYSKMDVMEDGSLLGDFRDEDCHILTKEIKKG